MQLSLLKRGERARILTIRGTDVVKKHLGALGFVPGVMVSVVQLGYGNMILGIHDSRIALNGDLAGRILVQPSAADRSH
ncbi:MAG: ferrous iron transport protein A [Kiritimatiellia bacterium]